MPAGGSENRPLLLASGLALAVPALLLAGAYISQYGFGLYPCEMCWWQRYPHGLAILLAGAAMLSPLSAPRTRVLTLLAAFAVTVSGLIGVFHAGVEYGWWEGLTSCSTGGAMSLDDIMAVPLIRCDQVQWSFLGISMAGWNAILSLGGAAAILLLIVKGGRR